MSKKSKSPAPAATTNQKTARAQGGRIYDEDSHQWLEPAEPPAAEPIVQATESPKAEE